MGRKSNVATLRNARWTPSPTPKVSPEQKVLRVLYRERDRVQGRIALVESLLEERERMKEQVTNIRDLAERVMEDVEVKTEEVARLTQTVAEKDARLAAVEETQKAQESRLSELEATLRALADA